MAASSFTMPAPFTGPDAVRRVIAPYLWNRGITRIDEIFISHADLDHFNGLPELLLKRFPVGRVTLTPTFSNKTTPGVEAALAAFEQHQIALRIAVAGERFEAGGVTFDVLHPPAEGPAGNENTRSMVLLVRYGGHTVLLTGDLEGEGASGWVRVRGRFRRLDVMCWPRTTAGRSRIRRCPARMARSSRGSMAVWAKPKLVVSCQRPGPTKHIVDAYSSVGATVWDTPTAGAVTVRCHNTGAIAEAFRSGELKVVSHGR